MSPASDSASNQTGSSSEAGHFLPSLSTHRGQARRGTALRSKIHPQTSHVGPEWAPYFKGKSCMQDLLSQIGFTLSSVAVTVATLCKHPPTQFLPVAASPWVFANQALPQQPLMLPPQWKKVPSPQSPKVVLIRPPECCLSRHQLRSQRHGNFHSITRHLPVGKSQVCEGGPGRHGASEYV